MKTYKCIFNLDSLHTPNHHKLFTVGKEYTTTPNGKKIIANNGLEYTIYFLKNFKSRFKEVEVKDPYPSFPW